MSDYICERCGNATRDGKPYAKKDSLKIHLKSKTQKCDPLLSNISREDLFKKVSNPEYRKIVEKTKSPVTARELFDKHSCYNKLNYGLDKIVFLEQENKIKYQRLSYNGVYVGYEFIVETFYHYFKSCVHVPVSEDYVHVRYDKETIVTFTPTEFLDHVIRPFVSKLRENEKFNKWCEHKYKDPDTKKYYAGGYDFNDYETNNKTLWERLVTKFVRPINTVSVKLLSEVKLVDF
jgi:hypothetical protein